MTIEELSDQLKRMYERARRNEASCQVHMFAILYADEISKHDYKLRDIVRLAKMSEGYIPEISKGLKLAKYVDIKPDQLSNLMAKDNKEHTV